MITENQTTVSDIESTPTYWLPFSITIHAELFGRPFLEQLADVGFQAEPGVTKHGLVVTESGSVRLITLEGEHTYSQVPIYGDEKQIIQNKARELAKTPSY